MIPLPFFPLEIWAALVSNVPASRVEVSTACDELAFVEPPSAGVPPRGTIFPGSRDFQHENDIVAKDFVCARGNWGFFSLSFFAVCIVFLA